MHGRNTHGTMDETETLRRAVPDDEVLRYGAPLRTGGRLGLTDDRLILAEDDEADSIPLDAVSEVTVEPFDWFLAVLSVALVGFGVASLPRSAALGAVFALLGLASLYRTYRRRGEVTVHVRDRAKPRRLYPADVEGFRAALSPLLDAPVGGEESTH